LFSFIPVWQQGDQIGRNFPFRPFGKSNPNLSKEGQTFYMVLKEDSYVVYFFPNWAQYWEHFSSTFWSFFGNISGTDVMIFKIFSPKNSAKKLAFLSQNKAK
jgi:hypothetical protein